MLSAEVEALAREIAGEPASPDLKELARRVAEAQIDLMRVRRVRQGLLAAALGDPDYMSPRLKAKMSRLLIKALRIIESDPSSPVPDEIMSRLEPPQGPNKFATILSDLAPRLTAMDRYERRALSRRKFAIRAFDAAQPHEHNRMQLTGHVPAIGS
jgi:hypothetical protein